MWQLTAIELFKIFKKPRTYIAFAAIAAIVLLVQLALYKDGETYLDFMMLSIKGSFIIEGNKINGYLVFYIILQTLLMHVPVLISLVAGDMIALIGLGGSLFLFGTSDLMVFKSDMLVLIDRNDVMWRYVLAYGFAAIAMFTVAALAFLFSVFADNSIGPIIAAMSVIILFTILTTMDIPFFNQIKPFLFTNHMLNWKGFFDRPVDYGEVLKSTLVLVGHIVFFVSLAIYSFRKKDILS